MLIVGYLAVKNVTSAACNNKVRDRSGAFHAMIISTGTVAILITIARLVFNQFFSLQKAMRSDDWVTLLALGTHISLIVILIAGATAHGLGRDIWTVPIRSLSTFGIYVYTLELLYRVEVTLLRIAIVLFYLSVFRGKTVRRLLWATLMFIMAFGFVTVAITVFQCTPISSSWTRYLGVPAHYCMNKLAASVAVNVILIFEDLWMISIPLFQVRIIKMRWTKKAGVIIMFLTGVL
jgi:hypothetical protein